MILLLALAGGLLVGVGWARWNHQLYRIPQLKHLWLIFAAFLPQLLIAYLPSTRHLLPDRPASLILMASLGLFFIFAWLNLNQPGILLLLIGLVSNLTVIAANGGWMPISPLTASRLAGTDILQILDIGSRIGPKDILLLPQNIRLEFLSDRFLLPAWLPYQAAFSLGDLLIGIGIFWLLTGPFIKKLHPNERAVSCLPATPSNPPRLSK